MKNFKKVLSLALALLMIVGCMVVAPVETKAAATYTKVTDLSQVTDGKYVIVATAADGKTYAMSSDPIDGIYRVQVSTTNGLALHADEKATAIPVWNIKAISGATNQVSIQTTRDSGKYIGPKDKKNNLTISSSAIAWTISDEGDTFKFTSVGLANGERYLSYSESGDYNRFRAYADKSSDSAYVQTFSLYKCEGDVVIPQAPVLTSSSTPAEIVNAAYTAVYDSVYIEGTHTLTGKVTERSENGDYTYIVVDNMKDKPINCYKLNLNSKTETIEVDDTITVSGTITHYGYTPQFASGCTLENYTAAGSGSGNGGGETTTPTDLDVPANATQKEIVELAYTLADGKKLKEQVTLTGVIKEIGDLDTNYNSRTATIIVDGLTEKPILCYGMKSILGATEEGLAALKALKAGDTIDVTGTIKRWGEDVEFYLPTFVMEGEETPEVPVVPEGATQSQIVDIAYTLLSGQKLEKEVTLTGVITEFKHSYTEGYDTIAAWIVVDGKEDKPILCYKLKGEGIETVAVGDTITVKGYLTNYNGTTIEFDGSSLVSFVDTGDNILPVFVVLFAGCALLAAGFVGRRKMA